MYVTVVKIFPFPLLSFLPRGLAVLVLLPSIRADPTFVADTIRISCDAAVDALLPVRIRASWAMGRRMLYICILFNMKNTTIRLFP